MTGLDRGSIGIAEVAGSRRRVLVMSNAAFARRFGRVLVAPDASAEPDEPRRPGWVGGAAAYFDVPKATTIPLDRVLESCGTAPRSVTALARRIVDEAMR